MLKAFALLFPLLLVSCGQSTSPKKKLQLKSIGHQSVIVLGAENGEEIKELAEQAGIKASGEKILLLSGDSRALEDLEFSASENFAYIEDESLQVIKSESETPDQQALYLAKRDFGLLDFWKKYPLADGRNVKVGVIDDGISAHQAGFKTTTTGERKFLKKATQSTFTTFNLSETEEGFETTVNEKRAAFESVDLNVDGSSEPWKIKVSSDGTSACLDVNRNSSFETQECKGSFSKTGEFVYTADPRFILMFEINLQKKSIQIFQPEKGEDSHGEGVASVLAGYQIGNIPGFDGVAPGARILDYDLSEATDRPEEREYTLGTFLIALDWLGSNGAEVINISYSFGYTSAKTQTFMSKAIDEIVKKHNFIISFSAGNNGPGLGSLNRRSIYPSSVLVAGAFVSKELDEVVHGVTGIPEEGRVVYYSSRGPGLGIGPVLLAPLSSLTNSSPDGGHRGFSGTSSASPALAGAAAILVSVIKQENLPFDASTAVHALRLSGKSLKSEPFIFQGFGIPQIERALGIYKDLINGRKFADIRVTLDRDAIDGVSVRGVFLRTSEVSRTTSRRISLTGTVSALASPDSRVNLLTPVKLQYSRGISGPRELWVSSSASNMFVDITPEEILGSDLEGFGEIKVLSSEDNSVMTIIPVTVVRDTNILNRPQAEFALSAQEGLRLPFSVPHGIKGIRVKAEVLDGDERVLILSVFDPQNIRVVQQRLSSDMWIPVTQPGFYQVGLAMGGGTPRGVKVKVTVEALDVKIRTKMANATGPVITVTNTKAPLNALLKLTPVSQVIGTTLISSRELSKPATITTSLKEGSYTVEMLPVTEFDMTYLFATCTISEKSPENIIKLSEGPSVTIPAAGSEVTFRCMPFDFGGIFDEVYEWQMRVVKNEKSLAVRMDIRKDQSLKVKFPAVSPGLYKVEIEDPFSLVSIPMGEVELR